MTAVTSSDDRHSRRRLAGQIGANARWGALDRDARTAATSPGRSAFWQKFLDQADGDPKRAENLRKLHYARMQQRSAEVRRRKRALTEAQDELRKLETELTDPAG